MGEFRGKKELWSVWGIKGGFPGGGGHSSCMMKAEQELPRNIRPEIDMECRRKRQSFYFLLFPLHQSAKVNKNRLKIWIASVGVSEPK